MTDNRGSADAHVSAYRPDIDGLRAVAVLSVVAYHLNKGLLPGGFLGVDIFFVISGYLITLILQKEIGGGTFTIRRFYERRVRRIMPALLLLLFAVTIASALILLPADLIGYARSVFATLAFSANFYFWRDTDYFGRLASEKPLLHLWSLGVEEQFYIFFPVLLMLCRRLRDSWTLALILVLLAGSFVLDILMIKVGGASPAFYLLPTRAWELAAGVALAIAPAMLPSRVTGLIAGVIGAGLIGVSLWLGPALGVLRLPIPTLAVLGAVGVIWAGSTKDNPVARLLSLKPVVGVGLISYSLYLWHWPILVLLEYREISALGPLSTVCALILMFAAAYVSWRFVERPFRSRALSVGRVLGWVAPAAVALATVAGGLLLTKGLPQRLSADAAQINARVGKAYRCEVGDYVASGASRGCLMNLPSRKPQDADVVMIGNSHALMYTPLVADLLKRRGLTGVLFNTNICLPSAAINISTACQKQVDYITVAEHLPAKVVIIGVKWGLDPTDEALVDTSGHPVDQTTGLIAGLSDTVGRLEKAGKTVMLIGPVAQPGWDVSSIASRSLAFHKPMTRPVFTTRSDFDRALGSAIAAFSARKDLVFVRPDLVQCGPDRCDYLRDGNSLFADENHIAQAALDLFRPPIERGLDEVLARAKAKT